MKMLIIEDDQNKIKQLKDFLNLKFPQSEMCEKYSYQSGLREIINNSFDVVILDMTMPTFDITPQETGGRPRPFGGKEIIMQMNRKGINIPVIVVTQFERFGDSSNIITLAQLREELNSLHMNTYMGTVYYNTSGSKWKCELEYLLRKLV